MGVQMQELVVSKIRIIRGGSATERARVRPDPLAISRTKSSKKEYQDYIERVARGEYKEMRWEMIGLEDVR